MYHKPLAYGIRAPELRNVAKRNKQLTANQVKTIFEKILAETTRLVIKDLVIFINSKVPKMTGRLRRDLMRHLRDSYVRSGVLRIFVQTSIDYAKRVNDFETHNVRHRGKRIRHRGKIIVLRDSKAIGHFFDEMIKFAIKMIRFHLERVKRRYSHQTRLKYNEMKIIKLW